VKRGKGIVRGVEARKRVEGTRVAIARGVVKAMGTESAITLPVVLCGAAGTMKTTNKRVMFSRAMLIRCLGAKERAGL